MILYAGSYTEMISENFGGYGEGIYCFDFDGSNGMLQLRHVTSGINPSYLSVPSAKYLYTHTEIIEAKRPRVQAYKISQTDFSLQFINEQEIPGGLPCHINFSEKNNCVLVACYETGNIIIYPVADNGKLLPHLKMLQNEGSSINKFRQERAHAHAVVVDEMSGNILVADLGIDKIMVYQVHKGASGLEITLKQALSLPPGSGPRHIAVHEQSKYGFAINELTGTVTIMHYDGEHFEQRGTYSALPKEFGGTPGAAAIRVSASGEFVYTSERGDDCISVLRFDNEKETLDIIQRQKTLGKTPRDICFDPTGNWLLAANQDSDSIAVFGVDKITGLLKPSHLVEDIKSPVCLAWLPFILF